MRFKTAALQASTNTTSYQLTPQAKLTMDTTTPHVQGNTIAKTTMDSVKEPTAPVMVTPPQIELPQDETPNLRS